jgi:hypothetical protein
VFLCTPDVSTLGVFYAFFKIFFGCNSLFFNTLTLVRKKTLKKLQKRFGRLVYLCVYLWKQNKKHKAMTKLTKKQAFKILLVNGILDNNIQFDSAINWVETLESINNLRKLSGWEELN